MFFSNIDYVKDASFYAPMIETMKEEVEYFMTYYHDDPRFISGWGHAYFCEEDGSCLEYNLATPLEHRCNICGKVYGDYIYNSCFISFMRNEAIVTTQKCAILYKLTKEEQYLDIIVTIFTFYAKNYEHFPEHNKTTLQQDLTNGDGVGKIMSQGLNEAVLAIRMLGSLEIIKDNMSAEWKQMLLEKMFQPMYELCGSQMKHIHNISAWHGSAIGIMGLFFGKQNWVKEALDSEFGLLAQIEKGVTGSGFWYEGSIHYNFYTIESILHFLVFAREYKQELPDIIPSKIFIMLDAAYHYAFDNDVFPNPSDGWPMVGMKTYTHIYYMAYKALGEQMIPYIQHIEGSQLERTKVPLADAYYYRNNIPLERMLFFPQIMEEPKEKTKERSSANFELSNCAILRNKHFNVFFKYGHQSKSHAHPDKMNVEIMVNGQVLTRDLSNSGYASKMCNHWHKSIAAHNTAVVNGVPSDVEQSGECITFTDKNVKARCQSYEHAVFERDLEICDTLLKDTFTITMTEQGVMDWFFHFETPIELQNIELETVKLFQEYGENNIQNSRELQLENLNFQIEHDLVTMDIFIEEGMKVYLARTYNNPANQMRDTLIIRKTGTNLCIRTEITAK